jgi:hypothetical protein
VTAHDAAVLARGLAELERIYAEGIRAFLPQNAQFERERIIAALANKREIAFVCGLLNEGENEAALILELIARALERDPAAPVEHMVEEMAYYLRTSIDETWQLAARPPSATAAVIYLAAALEERVSALQVRLPCDSSDVARDRRLLEEIEEREGRPSRAANARQT